MYAMPQQSYPSYPAQQQQQHQQQQQQQQQQQRQQLQPAPPPAARAYSGHGTSSAFSPSANPDEDWTKISDLAERRRIQNRIAQRNYRKKLKRRLEDLERRAGTSDDGSQTSSDKSSSQPSKTSSSTSKRASASCKKSTTSSSRNGSTKTVTQTFSPPMADDEYFLQASYEERERSTTPPMFTSYSAYPPPPEDMVPLPYGSGAPQHGPSYRPEYTSDYLATGVPVTLPPMNHFSDAVKRENPYGGATEETMYMHYPGYLPSIDMAGAPSAYDTSNPHTPPLSHSWDHSASCSDSGSYGEAYPTTPLSMPGSPYLIAKPT